MIRGYVSSGRILLVASMILRCVFRTFSFRFYATSKNIMKLKDTGAIQDIFPSCARKEITDLLNKGPQCIYAGFDPTADSLHVGNLMVIVHLLHWQRAGNKVIALLGGATGKIGDPSGKNNERTKIEQDVVYNNIEAIKKNIQTIFYNHERYLWKDETETLNPISIVNNETWYKEMNAIDFVSNLGRNFRMGSMMLKQSVQTRLTSESGMSFTEFAYQIFQAYDWYYLNKKFNCRFQVGGSDQMGNILAGHDLIDKFNKDQVYGITLPLVTNEEGDKFGKSAGNAIWLDGAKTTPFSLYQFFIRTKDSDVEKHLTYFTLFKPGEIKDLMLKHKTAPEKLTAQKKLAEFLTVLVHGEEGLEKALKTTEILYSRNIEEMSKLNEKEMNALFQDAHTVTLTLESGMSILDLAMAAKCFPSLDDAARIIKAGGFSINYQKVTNLEEIITQSVHVMANNVSLLRVGKRNYYVVKWV